MKRDLGATSVIYFVLLPFFFINAQIAQVAQLMLSNGLGNFDNHAGHALKKYRLNNYVIIEKEVELSCM